MLTVPLSLSLLISSVLAWGTNHQITVGGTFPNGTAKLLFDPANITAVAGDTVQFTFMAKNHTATQSSFLEPCAPLLGTAGQSIGFDTGFTNFVGANETSGFPTFNVTVNDTSPVWVYCKQTASPKTHCQSGMVFAINAPPTGHTFSLFQELALSSTAQNSPPPPVTHTIKVGGTDACGNPQLLFDPEYISAQPGDFVEFEFGVANHSATVSSFLEPCAHNGTDFDSGFMPTTANASVVPISGFTVQDTSPIWMYCRQPGKGPLTHCQSGMVFAVNPPPTGNTFAAFKALAMNSTSQNAPTNQASSKSSSKSSWSSTKSNWSPSKSPSSVPAAFNLADDTSHSDRNDGALFGLLGTVLFFMIVTVGITGTHYVRYYRTLDHVRSAGPNYRPVGFRVSKPETEESTEYQTPSGRYTDEN